MRGCARPVRSNGRRIFRSNWRRPKRSAIGSRADDYQVRRALARCVCLERNVLVEIVASIPASPPTLEPPTIPPSRRRPEPSSRLLQATSIALSSRQTQFRGLDESALASRARAGRPNVQEARRRPDRLLSSTLPLADALATVLRGSPTAFDRSRALQRTVACWAQARSLGATRSTSPTHAATTQPSKPQQSRSRISIEYGFPRYLPLPSPYGESERG
jgi:hypothetical protein